MSVMMLTDNTFSAVISWAMTHDKYHKSIAGWGREFDPQEIGAKLHYANAMAYDKRYSHHPDKGDHGTYKFKRYAKAATMPAVAAIKLCQCIRYQVEGEAEGPQIEAALAILDAIISGAINTLPGYDAAPWGLEND